MSLVCSVEVRVSWSRNDADIVVAPAFAIGKRVRTHVRTCVFVFACVLYRCVQSYLVCVYFG